MNSKIIIMLFSLFGELERDLVSSRTKEALAAKKHKAKPWENLKGLSRKANLIRMWTR
jgi:putative DNA-invertase from lambdoid prophage Rac